MSGGLRRLRGRRVRRWRVEAMCQSALAFDVVDVTRIGRMLKAAVLPGTPEESGGKVVRLEAPRFARSIEHFSTRTSSAGTSTSSGKEAT